jgi:hypothetical protein
MKLIDLPKDSEFTEITLFNPDDTTGTKTIVSKEDLLTNVEEEIDRLLTYINIAKENPYFCITLKLDSYNASTNSFFYFSSYYFQAEKVTFKLTIPFDINSKEPLKIYINNTPVAMGQYSNIYKLNSGVYTARKELGGILRLILPLTKNIEYYSYKDSYDGLMNPIILYEDGFEFVSYNVIGDKGENVKEPSFYSSGFDTYDLSYIADDTPPSKIFIKTSSTSATRQIPVCLQGYNSSSTFVSTNTPAIIPKNTQFYKVELK